LSNSITGTAVTRGGGGGGGNQQGYAVNGGTGGGGLGGLGRDSSGSPGTANTGGGGGGCSTYGFARNGGAGGSGIVIIRYPDSFDNLVAIGAGLTKTGGGLTPTTITGGFKIYEFTAGTGTITF
jgi:hypothetical protein